MREFFSTLALMVLLCSCQKDPQPALPENTDQPDVPVEVEEPIPSGRLWISGLPEQIVVGETGDFAVTVDYELGLLGDEVRNPEISISVIDGEGHLMQLGTSEPGVFKFRPMERGNTTIRAQVGRFYRDYDLTLFYKRVLHIGIPGKKYDYSSSAGINGFCSGGLYMALLDESKTMEEYWEEDKYTLGATYDVHITPKGGKRKGQTLSASDTCALSVHGVRMVDLSEKLKGYSEDEMYEGFVVDLDLRIDDTLMVLHPACFASEESVKYDFNLNVTYNNPNAVADNAGTQQRYEWSNEITMDIVDGCLDGWDVDMDYSEYEIHYAGRERVVSTYLRAKDPFAHDWEISLEDNGNYVLESDDMGPGVLVAEVKVSNELTYYREFPVVCNNLAELRAVFCQPEGREVSYVYQADLCFVASIYFTPNSFDAAVTLNARAEKKEKVDEYTLITDKLLHFEAGKYTVLGNVSDFKNVFTKYLLSYKSYKFYLDLTIESLTPYFYCDLDADYVYDALDGEGIDAVITLNGKVVERKRQ